MAQAKKKRKHKRHRHHHAHALFGISADQTTSYKETLKEGGLILLAAIAAGGAGAALGKHSLIAGIPLTLVGIHKKNKYIIAAGLGMTMSNGFQGSGSSMHGTEDTNVEGFDIAQITQNAKDRVSNFFSNFKDKLYLVKSADAGVSGLGETDEQVSYFVNPYQGTGELDTSALDRVQEQIAQMNKNVSGLNEIDREF